MKNSFVAFFDILGFKNLVEQNSHESLLEIYNESIYSSMDTFERFYKPIFNLITPTIENDSTLIKTFVISDSIIFIQETLSERGLLNLIGKSKVLLSMTLADGIPLRGAISYGPVSVIENERGTTIVGLGLTNAYIIESEQQWSGGIIDQKCFQLVNSSDATPLTERLLANNANPLIVKYKVPLKDNKRRIEFALVSSQV